MFPGKPSEFSVTPEGAINVTNGPRPTGVRSGQVADFVLQLEVYSGGKHLNSGIFFRNIPGEFWQGYESQMQNGYLNGDRTQPIDCGTGGFYRRQNARKVVPNDFEWFHKTLVVGRRSHGHLDQRLPGERLDRHAPPPRESPARAAAAAGTISIQGHDTHDGSSFRKLRMAEMPPR